MNQGRGGNAVWEVSELVDKTVLIYLKNIKWKEFYCLLHTYNFNFFGQILSWRNNSGHKQSTFRNGQCYGGQSINKAMDAYAITTDKGNIV
jgi:hypothetical protein